VVNRLKAETACGVCGASFVLRDREYYARASHWNGNACRNSINVSRKLVDSVMLDGLREDLADPAVVAEVEKRVRRLLKQRKAPKPAKQRKRIAEPQSEIDNLTDAIAKGMLRASPLPDSPYRRVHNVDCPSGIASGQEPPFTCSKDDARNDGYQSTGDAVQRRARGDEIPKGTFEDARHRPREKKASNSSTPKSGDGFHSA
jgi:hypothetical protein